jgi:2-polyprenyl-3-methyl-5-hydroxy-6-metoxy-1,4-benzoquinol methylase
MKFLDRVLQRWRIRKALPFIGPRSRLLDIGSSDGVLFEVAAARVAGGMGIDPTLKANCHAGSIPLIAGFFPKDMPAVEPFDVITMLAVLEHFPAEQYAQLTTGCVRYLKPGGFIIITVPSPFVDYILAALRSARLIDGMSLEEHHGYDVRETTQIFALPEFQLVRQKKFQLGLNNLFVFQRTGRPRS